MSTLSSANLRESLRKLSDEYSDSLRSETRRRIVTSAMDAASTHRAGSIWSMLPKLAAAAAVAMVLALPAFRINPTETGQDTSDVRDLQVTTRGDQVILTWQDGDKPHRVIRATSREELARLAELPGEIVRGERWVDSRSDDAAVVYYLVK